MDIRLISMAVVFVALTPWDTAGESPSRAAGIAFFESRIRPVLIEHCYECHNSPESAEGGFAVDHREALIAGGDGGKWMVPGDVKNSRLVAILKHEIDDLEMPQGGPKLEDRVVADFEKWILMGAPDPRDEPPSSESLAETTSWDATLERRKSWWSFQPIQHHQPPASNGPSNHPIDRFIQVKLDEAALPPAEPSQPSVLIRRLFVNLIGLPPRYDQFHQWMQRFETAGDAGRAAVTEDLVDQLLNSPRFGERWARHWMDWIRYAESHGSEGDPSIDNAWMFRDYLIRALNEDVPYDQLVREHVAGDLLSEPRINLELGINESMIGPAHWRMVFHGFAPTDPLDEKVRFIDDEVNAFSKAFLGLTVACARCHDHKFDAISQKDYYALFGILASCRPARTVIDLQDRQNKNRDALLHLKPKIRDAIARDWIEAMETLKEKLVSHDRSMTDSKRAKATAKDANGEQTNRLDRVLEMFDRIEQQASTGIDFSRAWKEAGDKWSLDHRPAATDGLLKRWDLAQANDYAQWSAHGIGLPEHPEAAGQFSVALAGERVITGIYPAGIYSHALSTKHPARLTSPDIDLGEETQLWVRAIGDGGASLRYAVHDYPRSGTVFPVTALKSDWKWHRYDLAYWLGESIHIELSCGKDSPLLVQPGERSWFGVTEARLVRKGTPAPQREDVYLGLLFDAAAETPPESAEEAIELCMHTIAEAIGDWQSGTLTNSQAELLDACLRQGWLPNDMKSLPIAKPLVDRYRLLDSEIPNLTRVPGLDETFGRTQPLFVRGNHKQPAENVPRRFLEAIDPTPYTASQGDRLRLAEDVLRDDNPLTRRVIVNRIWHHLFGSGIVATPDNFGRLGQKPTHPEMLDWLANRFSRDGWSMKRMIRLIVTSRTWQRSSSPSLAAQERDPENHSLSHANIRRMEAEAIRDTLLSASGRLDVKPYGTPVRGNSLRRSVYIEVIRNSLDPFLRAFDFPEPFSATGRRDATNVPAQSLTLMNDPRVADHATAFAMTVFDDDELKTDAQRINRMFVVALGRLPSTEDVLEVQRYLDSTKKSQAERRQRVASANSKIAQYQRTVQSILGPARQQVVNNAKAKGNLDAEAAPKPIASWEFKNGLQDKLGDSHGTAVAEAKIESDALVVGGQSYVVTSPLNESLTAKTLEAWVKLDRLDQRGGGVMTVQSADGVFFDSIVFGEKDPGQWLSGSNNFSRTQGFNARRETEAASRFVHIAIAYHANGRIACYREGNPYGEVYTSDGPYEFKSGRTIVSFGVRHLPAGGNRMLAGRIQRARLYDRALSPEEIMATSSGAGLVISKAHVISVLSEADRHQLESSQAEIQKLKNQVELMGPVAGTESEKDAWIDLARALFTFKEFIYVR